WDVWTDSELRVGPNSKYQASNTERFFMKCEWTKENVVLYMYDELPDDARFEFMHHIQHCEDCKRELEAAQGFKQDMSAMPAPEVSPNFLASNRKQLQEA